ncbi:MAG: DUF4837 family protein, partial [Bacteroidaceae bacterium]|nr:DUF4837 family protein [Bacteroidaceae bacterium]
MNPRNLLLVCKALPLLLCMSFLSCSSDGKGGGATSGDAVSQKPSSRGLPYELVLLIPRGLYTGELKDSLDAVLQGSTPILPQHEPIFRLDVVFTDTNLTPWRTFRNRLLVEVDSREKAPGWGMAYNTVARPQLEVRVVAPTAHALALFVGEQRQQLTDLFVEHELKYEIANLRRKHNGMTRDSLKSLCGHTICVPPSFRASKTEPDFLWTGTNLNDKDQNFIYYSYPWNEKPLTPQQFVAKHDSVLQRNIPGAREGQWMQTARLRTIPREDSNHSDVDGRSSETQSRSSEAQGRSSETQGRSSEMQGRSSEMQGLAEPLISSRLRVVNNKVVQEVRGLWELRNGALGGPFVA